MACFFLIMLMRGIIYKNWYIFIISDLSRFALMSFILYGNQNDIIKLYSNLGSYLFIGLPASLFFVLYYGVKPGTLEQRFISSGDIETSMFFFIIYPIAHSLFLFPIIGSFKKKIRIIIIISVFFIMIYSIMTLNRYFFITSLLSVITGLSFSKLRVKIKVLSFLVLGILVIQIISFKGFNLSESSKSLFYRLQMKNDIFSGRDIEAIEFINSLNKNEIIFGKGLGGSQKTWIWSELPYGNNMIHFGFLYIIMKGGLLFLIFIISIFVISCSFMLMKKGIFVPIAISILIFIIADFMHTQWLYPFNLIYIFSSISFAFHNDKKRSNLNQKGRAHENIIIKRL